MTHALLQVWATSPIDDADVPRMTNVGLFSTSFSYALQEAFQLAKSQSVYHRIQVIGVDLAINNIYQAPKSASATHDISCPANQSSVHTRYVQSIHVFLSDASRICQACSIQVFPSSWDQGIRCQN